MHHRLQDTWRTGGGRAKVIYTLLTFIYSFVLVVHEYAQLMVCVDLDSIKIILINHCAWQPLTRYKSQI